MDGDVLLLWFCRLSLIISTVILVWCGLTVAIKSRQDKEWLKTYVPTLGKEINVTAIRSLLTPPGVEIRQSEPPAKAPPKKEGEPVQVEPVDVPAPPRSNDLLDTNVLIDLLSGKTPGKKPPSAPRSRRG